MGSLTIIMHKIPGIIAFLILLYLVRLITIAWMPLAPDEAYYWYWAKHLDWSYFDHPPMAAYLMALFTGLGGDSEFFVRIGGLLCSLFTICLIYLTCRRLIPADRDTPWELLILFNVTLLFAAGCLIQTPDTPMILFWSLSVYCGVRILTGSSGTWWYLWGLSLGLGLLSKYTMILIVPCQFAFLLLAPEERRWLFRKEPYLALLIGLAVFSPVIFWNWKHDWISFAFQLQHGFRGGGPAPPLKLLEYLGGQAGLATPLLFLAFVFYSVRALKQCLRERNSVYLYLLMLSWPVIFFFAYSSMRGGVAQPNWPAPAYVAGLLLLGIIYSRFYREKRPHRIYMNVAVGFALLANVAIQAHLFRPYLPVPPKIDTTQQFYGWRELGQAINRHVGANPHQAGYFLVADRYSTAAGALFYTGKPYVAIDFSNPERYIFLRNPETLKGKNAIILLHHADERSLQYYRSYFREVKVIGKQPAVFRGEVIDEYSVYLLLGKDYRGNWQPFRAKKSL
jgi:4-amino-4-deoxy-L-arabinose transferase-like glycosyltransferase